MESQRFDDFSRKMASGASRRSVLRGLAGGALAAVGLGRGAAAQPNKIDICHLTGDGSYRHIRVSANAVDAHLAHGDRIPDTCDENFQLDYSTCECACPPTDCGPGNFLFPLACRCECQDINGSRGEYGASCTENGTCRRPAEGGSVCADTSSGACADGLCESSDDCDDGWLCVKGHGFEDYHCCPPG